MPDQDWEAFKKCVSIQGRLDLEAWDVMLFQPLKDLHAWWSRQGDGTKLFTGFLAGQGGAALARWLGRVASIAGAEVAALFAEALTVVVATLALATVMDAVGRCLIPAQV